MSALTTTRQRLRRASLGWAEGYAQTRSRTPVTPLTRPTARLAVGVLGLLDPWAFRVPFLTRSHALQLARSTDPLGAMLRLREALRAESAPLATLRALATAPTMIEGEIEGRSGRRFRLSTKVERAGSDPREILILVWDGPGADARAVGEISLHATTPWVIRDHVEIYHPDVRREGIVGAIRKRIAAAMPSGCRLINSLGGIVPDGLVLLAPHLDALRAGESPWARRLGELLDRLNEALAIYGSLGRRPCEHVFPESAWTRGVRPYLDESEKQLFKEAIAAALGRDPIRIEDERFASLAMIKMWRRGGLEPVAIDFENLKVHFVKDLAHASSLDLEALIHRCTGEARA